MYDFFDGFLNYISGLTCGCEFDPYSSAMNDVKDTVQTMAEISYQRDGEIYMQVVQCECKQRCERIYEMMKGENECFGGVYR